VRRFPYFPFLSPPSTESQHCTGVSLPPPFSFFPRETCVSRRWKSRRTGEKVAQPHLPPPPLPSKNLSRRHAPPLSLSSPAATATALREETHVAAESFLPFSFFLMFLPPAALLPFFFLSRYCGGENTEAAPAPFFFFFFFSFPPLRTARARESRRKQMREKQREGLLLSLFSPEVPGTVRGRLPSFFLFPAARRRNTKVDRSEPLFFPPPGGAAEKGKDETKNAPPPFLFFLKNLPPDPFFLSLLFFSQPGKGEYRGGGLIIRCCC